MFNWLSVQLLRLFLIVVATVLCFLPLELFLLLKHVLHPTGFWQNLVTYGLGLWVGGAIQLFLFIIWMVCIFTLTLGWDDALRGKPPIRLTVRRTPPRA